MGSSVRTVQLNPGQVFLDDVPLNDLFDLSKPGKYSIQASRYDYLRKVSAKSNSVELIVKP